MNSKVDAGYLLTVIIKAKDWAFVKNAAMAIKIKVFRGLNNNKSRLNFQSQTKSWPKGYHFPWIELKHTTGQTQGEKF